MRSRFGWWLVLGTGFAALRLWSFWPGREGFGPGVPGDPEEYLRVSRLRLLSMRFFTEHKPFGYPLFLKLTAQSLPVTVWLQLVVSLASWLFLAAVVARLLSGRVARRVAPASLLLLSCGWQTAQWDTVMMTESLTLSAFVLLVALALLVVQHVTPWRVAALVVDAIWMTSLRDTNAAVAAFVLVLVAAVVARRNPRRSLAAVLVLAAVGCVALVAGTVSVRRWEILVADEIRRRVVLNPPELAYFRRHGMPYRPDLARIIWTDTRAPRPAATFEHDPRLASFMPWFKEHARATYDDYLLTHPSVALLQPVEQYRLMLWDSGLQSYHSRGFRPLPSPLNAVAYPGWGTFALDAELLVAAAGLFGLLRKSGARTWLVPYGAMAFSLPLAVIVWDGEPSEVPRHALLVAVSARLGALLGGWLVVDAVLARRRAAALDATAFSEGSLTPIGP